ncbi:MAG: hypothetical protein NC828_04605, partial [Candidatus Omnitrophica bacterium]|nr:hypothetical protein [Candidatus Omnitrophota bacterium]
LEKIKQNVGDLKEIASKGALVFDIDGTLLYKEKDIKDGRVPPGITEDSQINKVVELFAGLLGKNQRLAIISGHDVDVQEKRLINPLKDYLSKNGKLNLIQNFTLFANAGATKVTYDAQGNRQVDQVYAQQFQFTQGEINTIKNKFENIVKNGQLLNWYKEEIEKAAGRKFSDDEIKNILRQAYQKDAQNRRVTWDQNNGNWIDNSANFQIQVREPPKEGETVTMPWIEIRRADKTNPNSPIVQVTIKPLPSAKGELGYEIGRSLRNRIIDELSPHLPTRTMLSGGTGSIDTGTNKKVALEEYMRNLALQNQYILYFGDEFTQRGGDFPITQIPGLNIFSASPSADEPKNVIPAGIGPISIWRLLEELLKII